MSPHKVAKGVTGKKAHPFRWAEAGSEEGLPPPLLMPWALCVAHLSPLALPAVGDRTYFGNTRKKGVNKNAAAGSSCFFHIKI